MLARIANNLYWTGRYLERSEHLARYLSVQYFSMLDAPMSQSRDFTLASILNMYGIGVEEGQQLVESQVLQKVGMSYSTPLSIRATIRSARENAGSLRHIISTELWQAINSYYLYSDNTKPEYFATHGLSEFTEEVGRHCANVRSRIDDTLLHDDAWVLIKLGIHLERVVQVIRILSSKLHDIDLMTDWGANQPLRQYQGTVVLKILEGFDMHKKLYQQVLTPKTTIDFLVGHPNFSRSLTYNMAAVTNLLTRMENKDTNEKNELLFSAGKLYSQFRYLEYDDIAENIGNHLDTSLQQVYSLHANIVSRYFGDV